MAGKNTIQVLRGKVTDTNKSEKLLEGQPFYNEDKNYLTIGRQGGTASLDSLPITVRELVGYASDSDKITNIKTNEYSLKYSNADNSLKITSPQGVDIDSGNGDVTLKRNNNSSLTLKSDSIEYANNSVSDSAVVNVITPSTAGFVFKDGGEGNLATVGMGKLKLNTLCDASTGTEQASVSKTGIEVRGDLKVNNVMTPRYIGTTNGKLDLSYNATGTDSVSLHVNTSSPSGKSKINKFVFFAGEGDKDTETERSPKADVVANTFWAERLKTTLLDVESDAAINVLLVNNTLLFKNSFACRIKDPVVENGEVTEAADNRPILERVDDGENTFIDLKNIRNMSMSGDITSSSGTITAQSFNAKSDKRLKENIVEYSLNKSILDLPIYSYNFISDEKKTKKIGCLAQDLKEICPEIVKEDDKGYLSIEENKIVYLLLDEVKKLKKRVDELEAR